MELHRINEGLMKLVRTALSPTDYHALYPCKVSSQNADNTLNLVPESPRMPPMDKVPIRLGIPGATVKVSPGARVLLGFENGDPSRPMATLWDTASLVEISFDGGSTPVAKEGSSVTGFAGPYPLSGAAVAAGAGSPKVKVP